MTSTTTPAPLGRWPDSTRKMGFGVMMPVSEGSAFGPTPTFQDIAGVARHAESLGLDALWFADHLIMQTPPGEGEIRGVWEPYPLMAGVAAVTESIAIGTMVSCLGWRHPAIVAKMVEMIDDISGGRFIFGVGAGWHEPEYEMFGFPWDHRVSRFEDAISIISPLLREGRADYRGEFWQANAAVNAPRGPRAAEGGAPVLFGSNGPRMLKLMARFGDAWNTNWHANAAEAQEKIDVVDRTFEEAGRDPATLVKTVGSNVAFAGATGRRANAISGSPQAVAEAFQSFRELGFRHMVVGLDPATNGGLDSLAEAISLVDKHNGE